VEWYDVAGGYINGDYHTPLSGTFGWTSINRTFTVPANAHKVLIGVHMVSNTTGTAWFDDVEVRSIPPALSGPKLVINPGFESGTSTPTTWFPASGITRDTVTKRTGTASMKITRATDSTAFIDGQPDLSFTDIVPGDKVHVSAWVKGENILSSNSTRGVGPCIEFLSPTTYLAGVFPVKKTTGSYDWTFVRGAYTVPQGATRLKVSMQVQAGIKGTAYFDDVVVQVERRALQVLPVYPNYRGTIHTSDTQAFSAKLLVRRLTGWTGTTLTVSQSLLAINDFGNTVYTGAGATPSSSTSGYLLTMKPTRPLATGGYYWRILVTDSTGYVHYFFVPIVVTGTMPDVYIDAQGFTRVKNDGTWDKFFPFGIYTDEPDNSELTTIATSEFNTVLAYLYGIISGYNAYVDNAYNNGLKVAYTINTFYKDKGSW
jgi:hypothetical protein